RPGGNVKSGPWARIGSPGKGGVFGKEPGSTMVLRFGSGQGYANGGGVVAGMVGMRFLHLMGRGMRVVFGLLLMLPILALVPSTILDVGPGGSPRTSLFPWALVIWDPFLRVCTWNSLAMAAGVAAVSTILGLCAALIAMGRR